MAMKWPTMYFNTNPPAGYAPNKPVWDQMSPQNVLTGTGVPADQVIPNELNTPPSPVGDMSVGRPDLLPNFGTPPTTQTGINLASDQGAGSSPSSGFNMGGFEPYYKNPEYLNLIKQWEASRGDAVAAQKAGLAGLEQRNQQYQNQPLQLDLSPLMALSDQWFGGDMGKQYKRPESPTDRVKALSDMEGALLKARGGISQEEQQYLQNRMGLMQKADETQAGMLMAQAKMQEARNVGDAARGAKADYKLQSEVERLQKNIGNDLPAVHTRMMELKKLVPEINQPAGNARRIPGLGVEKFTPDFLKSAQGAHIASLAKGLASDILRLQSGLTVTEPERAAKLAEMGMGVFSTPAQFIDAMQFIQKQLQSVAKNKEAGYSKAARQVFRENGGMSSDDFNAPVSESNRPETVIQNGVEYRLNPSTGKYE